MTFSPRKLLGARSSETIMEWKNKGHIRQSFFRMFVWLAQNAKIWTVFLKIYYNSGVFFFLRKLFFSLLVGNTHLDISEQKRVGIKLKSQFERLFHLSLIYLHFYFGSTKIKYSVDRNLHILGSSSER